MSDSCKIAKFVPCAEVDEELQSFAEEFFEVISIDYTDDGLEQLVGYMRPDTEEKDLVAYAENKGFALPEYKWEVLQSENWLTENVIKFAPLEEGDFYVYGIHEKNVDTHGKIGVKVYAATAFGSEHQTTRCCLKGINEVNKLAGAQKKILDVGTGSGILAIACAKLWKNSQSVAVDIDDESVKVAKQNALDNGVEQQIAVSYSDGYNSELVKNNAPYDLILANILARPLIAMAEDMARSLKKGGYAIISGFIDNQVDWVLDEHKKYGLELVKLYEKDNWRAALLEKK